MKITLEFKSLEDAEPHLKGWEYYSVINDFHYWMRSQLKHGELIEAKWSIYEEIQKKFFSILNENNVNLD